MLFGRMATKRKHTTELHEEIEPDLLIIVDGATEPLRVHRDVLKYHCRLSVGLTNAAGAQGWLSQGGPGVTDRPLLPPRFPLASPLAPPLAPPPGAAPNPLPIYIPCRCILDMPDNTPPGQPVTWDTRGLVLPDVEGPVTAIHVKTWVDLIYSSVDGRKVKLGNDLSTFKVGVTYIQKGVFTRAS